MRNTESNSRPQGAPQEWDHVPESVVQTVHELQQACGHDHILLVVTPAFSTCYLRCYCTLLNPSVSTLGFFADHLHRHVRRCSTNTQKTCRSHGLILLCTHMYSMECMLRGTARHVLHLHTTSPLWSSYPAAFPTLIPLSLSLCLSALPHINIP